jgi:hypothetical protein
MNHRTFVSSYAYILGHSDTVHTGEKTETRDRDRDTQETDSLSSAQLLPPAQPTRPRLLLSRRPLQRLAGVMALFALRCLSKIQAPIIQKLTPRPNVIRCLPSRLFPPRFARVHRLSALVGAIAHAWRGCLSVCKSTVHVGRYKQDLIPVRRGQDGNTYSKHSLLACPRY